MADDLMNSSADQLRERFYAGLAPVVAEFVRRAVARGAEVGTPLYLVGGAVRDLLLGRAVLDLDIVLEGDAIQFAGALTADSGLRATRSAAFRNAKVDLPPGEDGSGPVQHVDFVTARREMYPAPGQLPRVWPGKLAQDLARRDFTINAMALPLAGDGELIDPLAGRADLGVGLIRVLHDRSFRDDPTRIFRGARFEQRFGFVIERHTLNLIRNALHRGLLDLLTPDRVRHELLRSLAEPDPLRQLRRLGELGVLAAIEPALIWDERSEREFSQVMSSRSTSGDVAASRLLALLLYRLPAEGRERVAKRLNLDRQTTRLLGDLARLDAAHDQLTRCDPRPSEIDRSLSVADRPVAELAATAWHGTPAGDKVDHWLANPAAQPTLTGQDLKKLGLPPGPAYREVLAALRAAVLDGEVVGREQEIEFVRRWVERNT